VEKNEEQEARSGKKRFYSLLPASRPLSARRAVHLHDFVASYEGFEVGDLFLDIFAAVHLLPVNEGEDSGNLESGLSAR
jgi:hypothetical protein